MNPHKSTEEMSLIQDIDTPAVIVDLKIVKENINAYQKYCNDIGIKFTAIFFVSISFFALLKKLFIFWAWEVGG